MPSKRSRLQTLSPRLAQEAYGWWCLGKGTDTIARLLGESEAAVYNSLNHYRETRRLYGAAFESRVEQAEEGEPLQGQPIEGRGADGDEPQGQGNG